MEAYGISIRALEDGTIEYFESTVPCSVRAGSNLVCLLMGRQGNFGYLNKLKAFGYKHSISKRDLMIPQIMFSKEELEVQVTGNAEQEQEIKDLAFKLLFEEIERRTKRVCSWTNEFLSTWEEVN